MEIPKHILSFAPWTIAVVGVLKSHGCSRSTAYLLAGSIAGSVAAIGEFVQRYTPNHTPELRGCVWSCVGVGLGLGILMGHELIMSRCRQ